MKKCPDCDSEKIVRNAKIFDRTRNLTDDFSVAVDEYPDALVFKQRMHSEVRAAVCGDCGFMQLYAQSPEALWAAYQNQRKNVS